MSGWSYDDGHYPSCSYNADPQRYYPEENQNQKQQQSMQSQPPAPAQPSVSGFPENPNPFLVPNAHAAQPSIKGSNPRESRNKAEKQRRDKMSKSIARLISILPPVAGSGRKVDKTSVLRLAAHYIRSHKHVFGDTVCRAPKGPRFGMNFTRTFLKTMKGFLMTITYKGLIVVVSPNIQEYLGYTEVELLGQSFYNMIHPDDHLLLRKQLLPTSCRLTTNGELFLSKEPDAAIHAAEELKKEKRSFIVRFKKQTHLRSEPPEYITCHIEGSFRKSDGAGVSVDRVVQIGRRVRSRGNNPYASGNDIVFVGMVRPITDSFLNESKIEGFKMEYRTRHSVAGEIIQCEQRISLITGYMTHEVNGTNAMNFMHRDDVRWVVVALREMYDQRLLSGESCYRLMTKNGEFIYMRTKGNLDVDPKTQEVSSFVCVNTVVTEEEGKKLIQEMKNKFSIMVKNEKPKPDIESKITQIIETPAIPVEDPRQLEKVICHLVTDLPSSESGETLTKNSNQKISIPRLAIIPPKREQIAKAIEKSYSVIKTLRQSDNIQDLMDFSYPSPFSTPPSSPELPRVQNEDNQQIYDQLEGLRQFFIDDQDFLPQLAPDYNLAMPQPLSLQQLALAALSTERINMNQVPWPLEELQYDQRFLFPPILQNFPPLPVIQMDNNIPMEQMQNFQDNQIPLIHELQPIQLVMPEPGAAAADNDIYDLVQYLNRNRNGNEPDYADVLNNNIPMRMQQVDPDEEENMLDELDTSAEQADLMREIESIMEENNIVEINPGQDEQDEIFMLMQNTTQIFFHEGNLAADHNRIENYPIENNPADSNLNTNPPLESSPNNSSFLNSFSDDDELF